MSRGDRAGRTEPPARGAMGKTNLSRPLSSFVGRARALADLDRAFDLGARLVTLVGAPGIGKTRLARRWAELSGGRFLGGGGVWFCALTEARDAAFVCDAVARALSMSVPPTSSTEGAMAWIGEALAERGEVLLVLDDCDALARQVGRCAEAWCLRAPEARLLSTSRERLHVGGEHLIELGPLDVADEALPLFDERARAARGGEAEPFDDRATRLALVRELDGIPLAIELAAARSRVLSPAQILSRLSQKLELLADPSRGRHATLRSAIDASWEGLSNVERSALAQCAVFSGGFTIDAAERVLDVGGESVLEVIASLRDKSLLSAFRDGEASRLSMYASIREYAGERLAVDEGAAVRARHARHYLASARAWTDGFAIAILASAEARTKLAAERENLLSIARWASAISPTNLESATATIEAALALEPVMSTGGPHDELVSLLDAGVDAARTEGVDRRLGARLRVVRANTYGIRGRVKDSIDDLLVAIATATALDDRALAGETRVLLGIRLRQQGRYDEAWSEHQRARDELDGSPSRKFEALNYACMGRMQGDFARFDDSRALNEHAVTLARALGDRFVEGLALGNLAQIDQEAGDHDEARVRYEAAIEALREVDDPRYRAIYLGHSADLCWELGDLEAASERYRAAIDVLARLRIPRAEGFFRAALGGVHAQRGELEAAIAEHDRARSLLEGVSDPYYLDALSIHRLQVELAKARDRAAIVERLRALLPERPPLDVRFAARMVERALARPSNVAEPTPSLLIAADGARVRLPSGKTIELLRRGAVRRLLLALVDRRLHAPGSALDRAALLEAGWPGERVQPDAGGKRVRVAIATLRSLGLSRWIVTRDDGYLIDPTLTIAIDG